MLELGRPLSFFWFELKRWFFLRTLNGNALYCGSDKLSYLPTLADGVNVLTA